MITLGHAQVVHEALTVESAGETLSVLCLRATIPSSY